MDITENALPTCGDGQLVDFLRCVPARVGQALLYQQFGDLFAVARRFRASRPPKRVPFDARALSMARMSS